MPKFKKIIVLCLLPMACLFGQQRGGPSWAESFLASSRSNRALANKSHLQARGFNDSTINSLPPFQQNNIIPVGSSGTVMTELNTDDDHLFFRIDGYDKALKNVWQNDFKIDNKFDFIGEQTDSAFHYAVFNRFLPKNKIVLLRTSVGSGFQLKQEANLPYGMKMFTFRLVNEDCFMACQYKDRPVVLVFRAKEGTFKVLPDLLNRNAQILSLYADDLSFTVILKEIRGGNLWIKKYSNEGKIQSSYLIENNGRQFNEAKTVRVGQKLFVVGSYTKGITYRVQGLYTACLDENFSADKVHFTEFEQFKDLLNKKGKTPPFAVVNHLKPLDNGIICVFDFFDASLSNQEYVGKITYQSSMICRLDGSAKMLWNTVLGLDGLTDFIFTQRFRSQTANKTDILESNVKPAMRFLLNKDRIMGACQFGNQIITSLFDTKTGHIVANGTYQEAGNEQITGFLPWFDDNFLLWGRERKNLLARPTLYLRKIKIVEAE